MKNPSPPPPHGDPAPPIMIVPPHDGPAPTNMTAPPHDDPAPPSMTGPPHDDPAPPSMAVPPHDDLIRPDLAPPPFMGLVSLVDKLQRACTALADQGEKSALPADWDWDALPSIAVVGDQGAGKSSVLESLVGKDFLPKGSGSVTRRPLIVQLRTTDGTGEHAEFLHHPSKKYLNFSEVKTEIAACSKKKSAVPIRLSIFSPNVVNLTLIDLPGLTKAAVDGQLDSTAQEIENMVRGFIEKPNCILLVVSAAIQDLATSDAIKVSQEVDPEGGRTFGVLTKIDLMDEGTNAVKILEGRSCALPYRWTGVINRTQQDIDKGLDMTAAMRRDREYFANTPEYEHLAHRMGIEHLAKSVSKHLEFHVKSKFAASKLFSSFDMKTANKKRLLQGYTLRSFGSFPAYQALTEGPAHDIRFRCIVRVQDQVYASLLDHRHLKEAEEDAAAVAYKVILGEDSMDTLLKMVNQDDFPVVSTLKEFAIKKSVCEPRFSSSMVYETCKMTRWLSTVEVDGQVFIGEAARSKQLSVRKAASAAIAAFLEDGDTLMVSVVQGKRLVNAVPSKLKDESVQRHRRKRRKLRHE